MLPGQKASKEVDGRTKSTDHQFYDRWRSVCGRHWSAVVHPVTVYGLSTRAEGLGGIGSTRDIVTR